MKEVDVGKVIRQAERIISSRDRLLEYKPVGIKVETKNVIVMAVYLQSMINKMKEDYRRGINDRDDVYRGEDLGSVLLKRFVRESNKSRRMKTTKLSMSINEIGYLIRNVRLVTENIKLAKLDFVSAYVDRANTQSEGRKV